MDLAHSEAPAVNACGTLHPRRVSSCIRAGHHGEGEHESAFGDHWPGNEVGVFHDRAACPSCSAEVTP